MIVSTRMAKKVAGEVFEFTMWTYAFTMVGSAIGFIVITLLPA